jgi:hypothetical protein
MFSVEFVIAIVGLKNAAKLLLNILTLTITSVLIVNLKLYRRILIEQ